MKIVLQRVHSASVTVDASVVGSIGNGLLLLLGIERNDTKQSMEKVIAKSLKIRVWDDPDTDACWSKSVMDMDYEVLVVSQFTLQANLKKGSKPDFHNAMMTEDARVAFTECLETYRRIYKPEKIQTGSFGNMMRVSLENHGPVTLDPEWIEMQREWDSLFAVRLPPIRIKDKGGELSPSTAVQRIRRMQTETVWSPQASSVNSKTTLPGSGSQTPGRTNPMNHSSSLMVNPGESRSHHLDLPVRNVGFNRS